MRAYLGFAQHLRQTRPTSKRSAQICPFAVTTWRNSYLAGKMRHVHHAIAHIVLVKASVMWTPPVLPWLPVGPVAPAGQGDWCESHERRALVDVMPENPPHRLGLYSPSSVPHANRRNTPAAPWSPVAPVGPVKCAWAAKHQRIRLPRHKIP